ncbi:MAG TPA: phage holin family protein, partial [Bacteroidia bacterium]|nr:phage holin family protein [Bacteroidia bacterium]
FAKELKKDISEYVDLKVEHTKLLAYEKIAKLISASTSYLLIGLFSFFAFLFLSFTVAFYLGNITGSTAMGFGIVTIIYLVILLAILIFRKKYFENGMTNKIIGVLMEEDNDEDEEK